jgi:hypothetical protein
MGLDVVEFVMRVEETFDLKISDQDAQVLYTPRLIINYLMRRLLPAPADVCMSQRVFHNLRAALSQEVAVHRSSFRPQTNLLDLLPRDDSARIWNAVRHRLVARNWPRLAKPGWFFENPDAPRLCIVQDIVRFLIAKNTAHPDLPRHRWTRDQISQVVHALIWEELGLPAWKYTEDSRFHEDMGYD